MITRTYNVTFIEKQIMRRIHELNPKGDQSNDFEDRSARLHFLKFACHAVADDVIELEEEDLLFLFDGKLRQKDFGA